MKSFFNYAKNRILYNIFRFLFFLIVALILLCTKVNAATFLPEEYNAQLYDNSNGNLTSVTTQFNSNSGGSWFYGYIPLVANSSGGAWGITSPVIFTSGHTYTFSARVFTSCGSVKLSTYNRIGIGTNLSDAVSSYTNNTYVNEINSDYNTYNYIQFAFESQINGTYIVFPFSTGASGSNCEIQMTTISITDLGDSGVTEEQINQSLQSQTNVIENSISQSTNDIKGSISNTEDSINSNINDMEDSINSSINEQLGNKCQNLFNPTLRTPYTHRGITFTPIIENNYVSYYVVNGTRNQFDNAYALIGNMNLTKGTKIHVYSDGVALQLYHSSTNLLVNIYDSYTVDTNLSNVEFYVFTSKSPISNTDFKVMITTSNNSTFCPYGSYSSKLDDTNTKLEEANKTSKGIWDTLKNLPKTIIDGFLDLLLKVFVPEDDFFSNWFDEVKSMFEEQLGFLATPFTIIIEFIQRFTELSSSSDIIIDIPDIKVPNFENVTLIKSTTFNWSNLLNSKDSLKTLWTLYLDFIDVFLILNFIGLCSSIYARIFGGDTSNYEYYTVEDTYTINDSTGEVTNHRLNQRTTKRKKVN